MEIFPDPKALAPASPETKNRRPKKKPWTLTLVKVHGFFSNLS
jgi:hypothetical protein